MQMERLQVWQFFGLIVLAGAQSTTHSPDPQPSYLLLAPRVLRPGVPTSVSVTILTASSVTVSARIVQGNQTVASDFTTIGESESSHWQPYYLEVTGQMGKIKVFSNSTQLHFDAKGLSTFIQTDKLNYMPGQAVRIRAVSIHPDGKPYDPRGDLVRQWLSLDSVLGVVSQEYQLSENPPLGEWTIITTNFSTEKHFNVARYVLPNFEVVINAPDVMYKEDTLWGSVTAKYMYGKPVQGHMNITFLHSFYGYNEAYNEDREISGSTDFMFDIPSSYFPMSKRALKMFSLDGYMDDQYLMIAVNVTEQLTVSFDGYSQILRPSLNFVARLKISTYNDKPLTPEDQQKTVKVSVMQQKQTPWSMQRDQEEEMGPWLLNMSDPSKDVHPEEMLPKEMEFLVPADGVIPLNIQLMNETETLTIDAYFEDSHNTLQVFRSYTSPSDSYLQIQKPSEPLVIGSPLLLHIDRNFKMTEIHYIVKSKGQVVSYGKSSGVVTLVPEISWAPLACVVVYCVCPHGEIVNDAMQIPITQTLKNQVSLSWSDTTRRPADEVTLRVAVSEPASLVGILVVDKATKWKSSHNDITKETVLKEMMEYDVSTADAYSHTMTMGDPYSIFEKCDLVVLTDASLHRMNHPMRPEFSHSVPGFLPVLEPAGLRHPRRGAAAGDHSVTVIVAGSSTFEFVIPDIEGMSVDIVRDVSVGSQNVASVLVPIKPLVLGMIPVSVKAKSAAASDFIRRMVLVKAEGLEQSFSASLLFEHPPSGNSFSSQDVTFSFPADVVEGSERASVAVVGDILGPSISGLGSLIQMPYGCGEQNMINFAPNIYVLQYLSAVGQTDTETTERATGYMRNGYEQELLSAFVLRCFLQARPFISIDDQVLQGAAAWLGDRQEADGRYMEPGRVIHTELQGGLDGPVSLTAYAKYHSQVSAALMFLETRLALGVSSGVPMWSSPDGGLSSSWQPRSADIEMVSYLLLAQHKRGNVTQALSLMKWLSQQRNPDGGFGSTQDTVVALQALSTFAAHGGSHDFNLTIRVNADPSTTVAFFHIVQDNYLLHQSKQIEPKKELNLRLNVFYNIRNEGLMRRRRDAGEREAFNLDVELFDTAMVSHLYICSSLSEGLGLTATGMAIMEVGLLSGFHLQPNGVPINQVIKKVETVPGKVVLYLDSVTTEEMCVRIPLVVEFKVAKVQEANVIIYDYYEPRRRTVRTYTSEWRSQMSACSFCGSDCSQCRQVDYDYYDTSVMSHSTQSVPVRGLTPALFLLLIIIVM
ncbi:hypothetical protein FQN60_015483 [Etheostoma spectabile]|uniref:CD109 antigen n=1 Tax=Etheostoma spectabile TaxID=54343 RepID=A0A5J5CMJ9_9PERO|nr:hypothetical protein FQN60_015483 [Etheostoma spectabile]